jgi:hypothetical protein
MSIISNNFLVGRQVVLGPFGDSFAQNFEDVILGRVFPYSQGLYIDAGAQHPKKDSVTYAFYRRGWTGINIEPSLKYFGLLQKHRPKDINLCVAASNQNGYADFHDIENPSLSTLDVGFADRAVSRGFKKNKRTVTCKRLDDIIADNKVRHIDFLKIDVEGFERQVLEGFSFGVRPTVILIEATEPCSPKPNYHLWEELVTNQNYTMVYDDGLNRFYLDNNHSHLRECFHLPPNVFDGYRRRVTVAAVAYTLLAEAEDRFPSVISAGRSVTSIIARGAKRILSPSK